ncbi:MAG: phosphoribosylanthranilate isomerase [Candidatus Omnitrophica bacterium]|jgi:phosphoribosylanthranilate isomerase|nr:phosphoribosylanthranilate isomerase [Candidatus Omnitrophota bacterium]
MIKVKICGITNSADAQVSVKAGCDALGFIFYKKSPRYISPGEACTIIKKIPSRIIKIGVFVNNKEDYIKRIAKLCRLDMLQFHGNESARFCASFRDYKIIKTFRIKDKSSLKNILKYKLFAYLFDTYVKSKIGGTGKVFNWKLVRHIKGLTRPVFLSGGLNAENVNRAVAVVSPEWVDASSSLEASPGKKDHKKVKQFIKVAKKLKS